MINGTDKRISLVFEPWLLPVDTVRSLTDSQVDVLVDMASRYVSADVPLVVESAS